MLEEGESSNIEDRRGMGGRGLALGGGGIGTLILVLLVWLCGGDPRAVLDQLGAGGGDTTTIQQQQQTQTNQQQNDPEKKFISSVLKSTEDVWAQVLPQQAHIKYTDPKLVLFTDQTSSACGQANASTGPFYCPGDGKLYLDFAFFDELKRRFGAPGDFAQA
jgi:predicted metalloprotease